MTLSGKIRLMLSALSIAVTLGCSNKTLPTADVNYLSGSNGTITVRAIGSGSNQQDAMMDAGKNAVNVLLFRGLPESEQKTAIIGTNETEEIAKHKVYFEEFYNQKRYNTFIMSSVPVSDLIKQSGGQKRQAVDVKVNISALKKDLEQNNIVRRFGL